MLPAARSSYMHAIRSIAIAALVAISLTATTSNANAQPMARDLPACTAAQLTLASKPAEFEGMMHAEMSVRATNTSASACRLGPRGDLSFLDSEHAPLRIELAQQFIRGMHPGPVVLPVRMDPGTVAALRLRFAVGNGGPNEAAQCATPRFVRLRLDASYITAPIVARMCGPDIENSVPRVVETFFGRLTAPD